MKFYSVFDKKSGAYGKPFSSINDSTARRDFEIGVAEVGSLLNSYPEDFSLYFVGQFDTEKGVYSVLDNPVFVCNAPTNG